MNATTTWHRYYAEVVGNSRVTSAPPQANTAPGNMLRYAQLVVLLLCGLSLKLFYSAATPDELRWILGPTKMLVELLSGKSFAFESHAGYISSDRTFLIAASCAGVNFLITSFLLLSLKTWLSNRTRKLGWAFILTAALLAYVATLIANTVRISLALWFEPLAQQLGWLSSSFSLNELHRLEGIVVYFGFLLLLFMMSEKLTNAGRSRMSTDVARVLRQSLLPLAVYYAITLGIPFANGAYKGNAFGQHSLFVLLIPVLMISAIISFRSFAAFGKTCLAQKIGSPPIAGIARKLRNIDVSRVELKFRKD